MGFYWDNGKEETTIVYTVGAFIRGSRRSFRVLSLRVQGVGFRLRALGL